MQPDVIVIGGGVSGLAAAAEIARQGWRVRLIEARDRLGGRILSAKPAGWPQPVELGAEFVHGGNREIRALLERARVSTRPVKTNFWYCDQGVLMPMKDYWEKIGDVAGRIPRRDHGWSFHQFLQRQGNRISARDRALVEAYVGSFNAAPTDQIGAHALRDHRAGADTEDLKLRGRYDAVVRAMRRDLPANQVEVRLNTVVTGIEWKPGQVTVKTKAGGQGAAQIHRARAVAVTLPLGVLQAGRVKFSPRLKVQERLIASIGWGQVVRLTLRFDRKFWSAPFMPKALGAHQGREFGFLNAPGAAIPVWWALAAPAPILTGWAGGVVAARLARRSPAAVLNQALDSLAFIFRTSQSEMKRHVAGWVTHDWRRDPFALGAYSFPLAKKEGAPAKLAEPVAGTVFFAGEALASDYGTVHGAIESGTHAGQQLGAAFLAVAAQRIDVPVPGLGGF